MHRNTLGVLARIVMSAALLAFGGPAVGGEGMLVKLTLDPSTTSSSVTGRVFLMFSKQNSPEPRLVASYTLAYYFNDPIYPYPAIFATDVESWAPGAGIEIENNAAGYPYAKLSDLPPGTYNIQAVLNVYTKFRRADGHVIWAHKDQGEGQQFHLAPGNLVSEPVQIAFDPHKPPRLELKLTRVLPPIPPKPDTQYVKHVRIKTDLVSKFWGSDMYMGATVVLPKDYDRDVAVRYPVVFNHGHPLEGAPFDFPEQEPVDPGPKASAADRRRYEQQKVILAAWSSDDFPRMILVSLQHPTPFYDSSYLVNSANNGPWNDAFLKEMLPFLESKFRIIAAPYARTMVGGSTGGWVSAFLQIHHPDRFGGAWSFCPDPVDFSEFLNVNLYEDDNAFTVSGNEWLQPERVVARSVTGQPRTTARQLSQLSAVLGSRGRSGEFLDMWSAVYGPAGADGYPKLVWDHATGRIDREVAEYWRGQGFDLLVYLEQNWKRIGSQLVNKLHFGCGDMDNFYLNLGMYRLESFLESTKDPYYSGSFTWGRPMVGHQWSSATYHGYNPWPNALLVSMAESIAANAPDSALPWWRAREKTQSARTR